LPSATFPLLAVDNSRGDDPPEPPGVGCADKSLRAMPVVGGRLPPPSPAVKPRVDPNGCGFHAAARLSRASPGAPGCDTHSLFLLNAACGYSWCTILTHCHVCYP
jgi:hypothetical protein